MFLPWVLVLSEVPGKPMAAAAALACQIAPALDTDEDTGYPPFQGRA